MSKFSSVQYDTLGRTGLQVSRLSLGTAALGMKYGIDLPEYSDKTSFDEAAEVVNAALQSGINFFDTAPAYGFAEELIGEVVGGREDCIIATKVAVRQKDQSIPSSHELEKQVFLSLEQSLTRLKRDILDIVQLHSADSEILKNPQVMENLQKAKDAGLVKHLGATVYGKEAAFTALDQDIYDVVQVAYSILDQRFQRDFLPAAKEKGVGVFNRSALLFGALTDRMLHLDDDFFLPIKDKLFGIMEKRNIGWNDLPVYALRFCYSNNLLCSTLLGAGNKAELSKSLEAAEAGPISTSEFEADSIYGLTEEKFLNPIYWPIER